ncbi:unnamed protein product [Ectocarpus sp. CCAP 1310/34]|nr:unnamed protein product [Ectocarpus sp. CCAP 1310/34]
MGWPSANSGLVTKTRGSWFLSCLAV